MVSFVGFATRNLGCVLQEVYASRSKRPEDRTCRNSGNRHDRGQRGITVPVLRFGVVAVQAFLSAMRLTAGSPENQDGSDQKDRCHKLGGPGGFELPKDGLQTDGNPDRPQPGAHP